MLNLKKMLYDFQHEDENDFIVYTELLNEFKKIECDIIEELDQSISPDKKILKYRNQLNKLLSNLPPYTVDEYDILTKHKSENGDQI